MKELFSLILFGLRLKPYDFNFSLHCQISPEYAKWKKDRSDMFALMAEQVALIRGAMMNLGQALSLTKDQVEVFDHSLQNHANAIQVERDLDAKYLQFKV